MTGLFADQGRHVDPQGAVTDTAEPERRIEAPPSLVDSDLGCGSHKGEIRLPRADPAR